MKYFKVSIKRGIPRSELVYPGGIDKYMKEVANYKVDHLYYDDLESLLLVIPDKDATGVAREGIEEITEAEAIAISLAKEPQREQITDPAKITRIQIKVGLNQALTADELRAIDPNDATLGINKVKRLADRIVELKSKEANL